MEIQQFEKLTAQNGIILTKDQLQKFQIYLSMLLKWNKVYNLTSIRKKDEIITKHFLDSLTLVKVFEEKNISLNNKKIADLGTGAGFPGIPLKIYYQDKIDLYLIDSVQKKCLFLEMLKKELNLEYTVICKRAEEIKDIKFDIVVSRATGETFDVLKWSKDLLKEKGYLIIMKGKQVEEELRPFVVPIKFKGLPERKIIVLKKEQEIKK